MGARPGIRIQDAAAVRLPRGRHRVLGHPGPSVGLRYHEKFQERAEAELRLELNAAELRAQVVQAQLGALKMQLQPHFLFNTLNAIVGMVRTGEVQQRSAR